MLGQHRAGWARRTYTGTLYGKKVTEWVSSGKYHNVEQLSNTRRKHEVCYVETFIMILWILADILQDLHDVHDRLQDLTQMLHHHILPFNMIMLKQKIKFDDVVKQRGIMGTVNLTVKQPLLQI